MTTRSEPSVRAAAAGRRTSRREQPSEARAPRRGWRARAGRRHDDDAFATKGETAEEWIGELPGPRLAPGLAQVFQQEILDPLVHHSPVETSPVDAEFGHPIHVEPIQTASVANDAFRLQESARVREACFQSPGVSTTMIYTHALNRGARGVTSPLDADQ